MTHFVENPETHVALLGLMVIGGSMVYLVLKWVREGPVTPDPWDLKIEKEIQEPNAIQTCHKCSAPQPIGQWFCEHCGVAVGDYNNLMPYVRVFSEGEVLRNGITEKIRINALTIVGYLLYSMMFFVPVFTLALISAASSDWSMFFGLSALLIPVPVYWFLLFHNFQRTRQELAGNTETPGNPS